MRLLAGCFPLLIGIAPERYDAAAVQGMHDAFEPYYRRGQRYALLSIQPRGSVAPGAKERKMLMDWVGSPRVLEYASRLCVGAAAVVDGAMMRGALTAVLWVWKPPFPLHAAATVSEGIDHCVQRLVAAGVPLPAHAPELQIRAARTLEAALAEVRRSA
jgi:hypothetical protein